MRYYQAVVKTGCLNKYHKIQDAYKIWKKCPTLCFYQSPINQKQYIGTMRNLKKLLPLEIEMIESLSITKNSIQTHISLAMYKEREAEYIEAKEKIHQFYSKRVSVQSQSSYTLKDTIHEEREMKPTHRTKPLGSPSYNDR